MVRRTAVRTIAVCVAAAWLLAACDFARSTSNYPPFVPYVLGEIDLSSSLGGSVRDVRMEAVVYPGTSQRYLAIVVEPDSAAEDTLVVLDQSFSPVVIERSSNILSFDTSLFVNNGGGVQLGNVNYDPDTGVVSNVIRLENSYEPIITHPTAYVLFQTDAGVDLNLSRRDFDWGPSGLGDAIRAAFSDGRTVDAVDAMVRYTGGTPVEVSVFVRDSNRAVYRRTVAWETLDLDTPGFAAWIDLAASDTVAYPELDFDSLVDTPDGLLYVDGTRLVRVNRTTGGIIDTFDTGENPRTGKEYPIAFDPAGDFYLLFDTALQTLYKVAPWW